MKTVNEKVKNVNDLTNSQFSQITTYGKKTRIKSKSRSNVGNNNFKMTLAAVSKQSDDDNYHWLWRQVFRVWITHALTVWLLTVTQAVLFIVEQQ